MLQALRKRERKVHKRAWVWKIKPELAKSFIVQRAKILTDHQGIKKLGCSSSGVKDDWMAKHIKEMAMTSKSLITIQVPPFGSTSVLMCSSKDEPDVGLFSLTILTLCVCPLSLQTEVLSYWVSLFKTRKTCISFFFIAGDSLAFRVSYCFLFYAIGGGW